MRAFVRDCWAARCSGTGVRERSRSWAWHARQRRLPVNHDKERPSRSTASSATPAWTFDTRPATSASSPLSVRVTAMRNHGPGRRRPPSPIDPPRPTLLDVVARRRIRERGAVDAAGGRRRTANAGDGRGCMPPDGALNNGSRLHRGLTGRFPGRPSRAIERAGLRRCGRTQRAAVILRVSALTSFARAAASTVAPIVRSGFGAFRPIVSVMPTPIRSRPGAGASKGSIAGTPESHEAPGLRVRTVRSWLSASRDGDIGRSRAADDDARLGP